MRGIVGDVAPDNILVNLLKNSRWSIDQAVAQYYDKGYGEKYAPKALHSVAAGTVTDKNIDTLFKKFATGSLIEEEGIEKFYNSIGVQATDPVTLLISFAMNAQTGGEYS